MLYLFSLLCSAWRAWSRFWVTVITRALSAASTGTIREIPPFSDGTQPRLIPRNIRSSGLPFAIRFLMTSTRPRRRISWMTIGTRPARGLYFSSL